jgi:hypothetical protein
MAPTALNIEDSASNTNGTIIGGRPVRIANCSGSEGHKVRATHFLEIRRDINLRITADPGELMLRQATEGPVDAITGDYLAGMPY